MGHCWVGWVGGRCRKQISRKGGIVFTGKTSYRSLSYDSYRLLLWLCNVHQGHRGCRHWTENIRFPIIITISIFLLASLVTLAISLTFLRLSPFYAEMILLGEYDLWMTVKVNPDHLRNEITSRLGQDLLLIKKFHVNPCITFCVRCTHRQNDIQTDVIE